MDKMLDRISSKFYNTFAVGTKMAGAGTAASRMATALATPVNSNASEVNYRPAIQQWVVCTP